MRKVVAMLLAVLLCLGPGSKAEGVSFEDDLGRTVTVEDPQRVAVLIGSFAQMWYLAGGLDTMVATASDAWTGFDIPLR